ncbi:MAG: hypothetical protein ACE5EE_07060 [Fidelibacterota bacterium]
MAVDYDNRIAHITWTDFESGSKIRFRRLERISNLGPLLTLDSAEGGESYFYSVPRTEPLDLPRNNLERVLGSMPVIAPNGDVFVSWLRHTLGDNGGQSGIIKLAKIINDRTTLDYIVTVTDPAFGVANEAIDDNSALEIKSWNSVSLAIDPTSGDLYITYTAKDNKDVNIYLTKSTDGGLDWSSPMLFATENTDRWQFHNWISIDDEGTLYLSYYELTQDFTPMLIDVFVARSTDGGQTFEENTSH